MDNKRYGIIDKNSQTEKHLKDTSFEFGKPYPLLGLTGGKVVLENQDDGTLMEVFTRYCRLLPEGKTEI